MTTQDERDECAKQHGGNHTSECAWIVWISEGKYYPNPGCTCQTTEAYQKADSVEIYFHPDALIKP